MSSISFAIVGLGVRGKLCCRAVERESLCSCGVLLSVVLGCVGIPGTPGYLVFLILAWGSEFMDCALLKPAVWHGLTPRLPSHYTVPYDQVRMTNLLCIYHSNHV